MATIKHISSKNADYGAAESYLIFQHDEFTMKPVLDGDGRMILREDYRIGTLNCGEEDFALSCIRSNMKYKKNSQREDVKSHHYIISFDPRDAKENGLTVDRAQELGLDYCKEHFPGHQAIVCTHLDGHNHSGNIHMHIVINSLRIADVERKPYMDRPCDSRAGAKHRCTAAAMRYFRSEVMEMCHREGLYQIDLLNGGREKVTEREYWAKKRGQKKLDGQNDPMVAGGVAPRKTKFETEKDGLRNAIRTVLAAAVSFEDFSARLMQGYGIAVKESRGRYSYLTPDRTKPITARKLGTDFDREAPLAAFAENAAREALRGAIRSERDTVQQIKGKERQIAENKELMRQAENYRRTKPAYDGLKKIRSAKRRAEYEEENRTELALFAAAGRHFKSKGLTKLPQRARLQEENERLISEKNGLYGELREKRAKTGELQSIKANLDTMLRRERQTHKELDVFL